MVSTISQIIANGHAYAVEGGDVLFDVGSLPGYGRLSGRNQVGFNSDLGGWALRVRAGGLKRRAETHPWFI